MFLTEYYIGCHSMEGNMKGFDCCQQYCVCTAGNSNYLLPKFGGIMSSGSVFMTCQTSCFRRGRILTEY